MFVRFFCFTQFLVLLNALVGIQEILSIGITLAQSQTQKFTLGTQTVTVTHNYSTTKQSAKIKIDETELKINIKSLSSQLYFLKIINSNNESIYFNKFLKQ